MSLSGALISSISGLQTNQRQMQVTSNNVANANVEGYSRKTASPNSVVVGGRNAGVDLSQVTRQVNDFLNAEVRRSHTDLGVLETKDGFLKRVGSLFGTLDSDSTLANGVNELQSAMEALALDPESATVRNDVVESADALARRLNRFAGEVQQLRVEADRQIAQAVDDANTAMTRIAELNAEISRGLALEEPIGELQDERDRQLNTLSKLMDITSFERENGQIAVVGRIDDATTAGTDEGNVRTLVDGTAAQFQFDAATTLGVGGSGNTPRLTSDTDIALNASTGGKLGALIEMRDSGLPNVQDEIDRLAATVRDRVNAAHNQGTFGNAGQASITGTTDLSSDTLTGAAGTVTLNEVDANGEVTATHAVALGAVGSFADLETALTVGNIDATITGGQMVLTHTGGGSLTVDTGDATVTGDYGTRGLSHYLGLNDLFQTPNVPSNPATDATAIANASGQLQVRDDIHADPTLLSRGTARSSVGGAAVAAGDNTVAQQLAESFEQSGTIGASGRLDAVNTTMAGYAGDILGVHANAVAGMERDLEFQNTLHTELEYRAQSQSGVNIDEELANIVTFEQAYNASARVISTVQEMFDTLDRMLN